MNFWAEEIMMPTRNKLELEGKNAMKGTQVSAVDLRGGAAVVIAGLAAEGITVIDNIGLIERGYDNIVGKLAGIGADIRLVSFPD